MVIIFGISGMMVIVAAVVTYAMGEFLLDGFSAAATIVIDKLPIVEIVFLVALLGYSIFYGMKKKRFISGFVMLISWLKSIFFVFIGIEAFLEIIIAAEGIFMTILILPFAYAVAILLPGFEMYTTVKAWEIFKEDGTFTSPLIQSGVVYGIFVVLSFL